MFSAIAALALSAASAHSSDTLASTTAWWERVTVITSDNGKTSYCRYETSLEPNRQRQCTASDSQAALASPASTKDQSTSITIERRFTPGAKPEAAALQPGETFLGGQVMALGIDARGAVKQCKVVAASGAVTPQYGCDDAQAEKFDANVRRGPAQPSERQGYMTVIVYGHSEDLA